MTIIGIDDTDSATEGMCTTYVGHRIAERLRSDGYTVERVVLFRLNPAAKHKTRGNACVAVHTTAPAPDAHDIAQTCVETLSATGDEQTNPGIVTFDGDEPPAEFGDYALRVVRELVPLSSALSLIEEHDLAVSAIGNGRGRIGATAAIGAWEALQSYGDHTYERILYREADAWGTPRRVDAESVFEAASVGYPEVWDTVDKRDGEPVAVPATPCPILCGIRGDSVAAITTACEAIDSEPVQSAEVFVSNQGTDMHLRDETIDGLDENRGYRVSGTVESAPETRRGGHVFFTLSDSTGEVSCVAFEPTHQFRDYIRALRTGDSVTVCGEYDDGTVKLEKIRVDELVTTTTENPTCEGCGNSMSSAGANQGFRCRDCGTHAETKVSVPLERGLERGWYEVPPYARRHIAKPLVRGGFDAPTHVER